jgi:hypothetical protein
MSLCQKDMKSKLDFCWFFVLRLNFSRIIHVFRHLHVESIRIGANGFPLSLRRTTCSVFFANRNSSTGKNDDSLNRYQHSVAIPFQFKCYYSTGANAATREITIISRLTEIYLEINVFKISRNYSNDGSKPCDSAQNHLNALRHERETP